MFSIIAFTVSERHQSIIMYTFIQKTASAFVEQQHKRGVMGASVWNPAFLVGWNYWTALKENFWWSPVQGWNVQKLKRLAFKQETVGGLVKSCSITNISLESNWTAITIYHIKSNLSLFFTVSPQLVSLPVELNINQQSTISFRQPIYIPHFVLCVATRKGWGEVM